MKAYRLIFRTENLATPLRIRFDFAVSISLFLNMPRRTFLAETPSPGGSALQKSVEHGVDINDALVLAGRIEI